jgi:hypothetical protein
LLAPTPTTEFSDIVEAVRAVEEYRGDADLGTWVIGIKLIDEVGPPVKPSEHTGSTEKFEQISKVLERAGYRKRGERKYSVIWLRKVRDTTYYFMFPADRRLSAQGVSFWVHEAARNPDNLDQIVKEAKGKKLTVDYAQDWLERQKPKPKRRSDVIAKMKFLTVLRTLLGLLPNLSIPDIEALIKESTNFIAACKRQIDERRELREAAE